MNQVIYKQLVFSLWKNFFFLSQVQVLSLVSIIKQVKSKHKNVFVNKLVSIRVRFLTIYIHTHTCLKYIYINLKLDCISLSIGLYDIKLLFVTY